jgi:predicted porin
MKSDFNSAGEQAWMVGLTYNFSRLGLDGLSMNTKYASGHNAEDFSSGIKRPDEQEFDITFDYYPPAGRPLAGFWLRVRGAKRWQDGQDDTHDIRVLLNYTYSIK